MSDIEESRAPLDLAELTISQFSGILGSRFRLQAHENSVVEIELADVGSWGSDGSGRMPFWLLFRGSRELRLPQRIYRLEHDTLGVLEIFLVPLQPDAKGSKFEAVFS